MNITYKFPGISKFVDRSGITPALAARITSVFYVARIIDAISQIPGAHDDKSRREMLALAIENRNALINAIRTVDAAIDEVRRECLPDFRTDHEGQSGFSQPPKRKS